jgi:hypothetical protein
MEILDYENELNDLEVDYKDVDEVEKEITNLSLALEYYNNSIVNRPNEITLEYLYKLENDYKDIISLNSSYPSIAYTAYDVSLESFISVENKFNRFATNVVEFIKKLIGWVISKINSMFKIFRNTRRKLINIVAKILQNNDEILDRLKDIRNTDLSAFSTEIDYKEIKDEVEEFITKYPGFYIGIDRFDEIFNYNGDIDSINRETRLIIDILDNNLLETRAYLKRHYSEYDFNKLYNDLINVKTAKVRDSAFLLKAKTILNNANAIDKKAKDVFITNLNKNKVTIVNLFKPTNDTNDIIIVDEIPIASKAMKEFKDPISLDYVFRKVVAGLHNIDKDITYNRDIVTDIMSNYDKTMELAETLVNSPTFNNSEELKNVVLFINKNIFPLIFKGYMNQYLGLVLSFNNRIKLVNLIIDKIYNKVTQKDSITQ